MWHEGTIGIPRKDGNSVIAHYWVKAYEESNIYGIEEGRITTLTIRIKGEITCHYDGGWEVEIDKDDEPTFIAYSILLKEYN